MRVCACGAALRVTYAVCVCVCGTDSWDGFGCVGGRRAREAGVSGPLARRDEFRKTLIIDMRHAHARARVKFDRETFNTRSRSRSRTGKGLNPFYMGVRWPRVIARSHLARARLIPIVNCCFLLCVDG